MKLSEVVVVTITLARTPAEEAALLRSLAKLSAPGLAFIVADGGSSKGFKTRLLNLGTISCLVTPKEKGLVRQVKAGLCMALMQFPNKTAILYTEPDKYPFFERRWLDFISAVQVTKRFGVAVASRDENSFRSFPKGQQSTEAFMNEAFSWILGRKGDYCYGPLLLSRRAAEIALEAPNELGWGWRFWTMRQAHAAALRVRTMPMDLPCPKEQRRENSVEDRLYRLKQLEQNIRAATSYHLGSA